MSRAGSARWLVPVAMAVLVMAASAARPPTVLGHAQLVSSSPGAGEVVPDAPAELRLVFSERLELAYTRLSIADADGKPVPTGPHRLDPGDARVLDVPLDGLVEGAYSVTWRALSADDGHLTQGTFSFGVGDAELGGGGHGGMGMGGVDGGMAEHRASLLEILARTLAYAGAGLGFGLGVLFWLVFGTAPEEVRRRLRQLQLAALAVGAAGSAVLGLTGALALAEGAGAGGGSIVETVPGYLLGSRVGSLVLLRCLVLAAGAGICALLLRRRSVRAAVAAGAGAAAIALVLTALPSHAAAFDSPAPLAADLVHLGAMSVWFSGLVALLVTAGAILQGQMDKASLHDLVPRFSALALVSVGLLGATGIYLEWIMTQQLLPFDSSFGRTLTLKVAVGLGAFALGALNFFDAGRGRRWLGGLPRRLSLEAVLAFGVIVLTASLTTDVPPADGRPVPIARAASSVTSPATLELGLQPARPGPNRAVAVVPDRGPGDGSAELLLQRLDSSAGPSRIELRMIDPPGAAVAAFEAPSLLLEAGSSWDATVVLLDEAGGEWGRQRFAFAFDERGLSAGRATPPIPVTLLIGAALLIGAVVAGGYWLGGGSLPRTERLAGRVALASGSLVGVVLGGLMLLAGPRL